MQPLPAPSNVATLAREPDVAPSIERRIRNAEEIEDALHQARVANEIVADVETIRTQALELRAIAAALANDRGVTQRALAEDLGLTKPWVQKIIEYGRKVLADRVDGLDKRLDNAEKNTGPLRRGPGG